MVETTTVLPGIAGNLLPSVTLSMWNLERPTMSRMSVPNALTTESAKGLAASQSGAFGVKKGKRLFFDTLRSAQVRRVSVERLSPF